MFKYFQRIFFFKRRLKGTKKYIWRDSSFLLFSWWTAFIAGSNYTLTLKTRILGMVQNAFFHIIFDLQQTHENKSITDDETLIVYKKRILLRCGKKIAKKCFQQFKNICIEGAWLWEILKKLKNTKRRILEKTYFVSFNKDSNNSIFSFWTCNKRSYNFLFSLKCFFCRWWTDPRIFLKISVVFISVTILRFEKPEADEQDQRRTGLAEILFFLNTLFLSFK